MSNGNETNLVPGSGKLPIRPMLPARVDPKIEKNFIWMWEELARYLNKAVAAIPYTENNANLEQVGGGTSFDEIPIGTNFNNFADNNYWINVGGEDLWVLTRGSGNLLITSSYEQNNNNYYINRTMGIQGLRFRPFVRFDANGELEVKVNLALADRGNWNNTLGYNYSTVGLGLLTHFYPYITGFQLTSQSAANNLIWHGVKYLSTDAAQTGSAHTYTTAVQANHNDLIDSAQFRIRMTAPYNNDWESANANQHVPIAEHWDSPNNNWHSDYTLPGIRAANYAPDGLRFFVGGMGVFFPPGGYQVRVNSFEVVKGRITF